MTQKITDRSQAPKIKIPEEISIAKAQKRELENGKSIFFIQQGLPELIRFEAIFDAGTVKHRNPMVPNFTNSMLDEGTTTYKTKDLAEKLDFLATNLNLNVGKHTGTLTVHCLKKHFEKVLDLFTSMITEPTFPNNELEIVRQNQYQNFLIRMENTEKLASDKFWEVIFGENHPYGIATRAENFTEIQAEDLRQFHKEYYKAEQAVFLFSGQIDSSTESLLNQKLKHFAPEQKQQYNFALEEFSAQPQKQHFIHKAGAMQASVRIGKPSINKLHPDYIKLSIVNVLLGGYFGSRLMTNIREDKGYTYGIYSSLSSLYASGYFMISAETKQESVKDAAEEIRKEIRKLCSETVPREELQTVKHYLLGSLLQNFDGTDATANAFKSVLLYGLDESWYFDFIETLKIITPEEIRSVANKYLQEDSMYEVICADKNKL